jgi:hypothetical protein
MKHTSVDIRFASCHTSHLFAPETTRHEKPNSEKFFSLLKRIITPIPSTCMLCAALASIGSAWADDPVRTPGAIRQVIPAKVLSEIEIRAHQIGLSKEQLQSLMASLNDKNLSQLRDLADARNASQLERLIPGISAVNNLVVSDPSRSSGGSSKGSAVEQGIGRQLTEGPGQRDPGRTGQLSVGSGCIACPNTLTMGGNSGQPAKQAGEEPKTIQTAIGGTIKIYSDSSVSIQNADGSTEYLNSEGRIVDKNGSPITPNPQRDAQSNRVTAQNLREIEARRGSKGTPNPNRDGVGAGGAVDPGRVNTVGSRATFTEDGVATRASVADLQEIMRIAIEKLGGPIGGR